LSTVDATCHARIAWHDERKGNEGGVKAAIV